MNPDEFRTEARELIAEISSSYGVAEDKAFLVWAADLLLGVERDEAYQAAMLGGKNDLGLDFGYIDEAEKRILLAQGKYSDEVDRDAIRSLAAVPDLLSDPDELRRRRANRRVFEFAMDFRLAKANGYDTHSYLIHFAPMSEPVKGELKQGMEQYGFAELKEAFETRSPISFGRVPDEVDLRLEPEMFFKLEDRPGKARCFVTRIPLLELHRLYRLYREGLLDKNIRLHVGGRTPANKGMAKTLGDPKESPNFFYYNNGLCIICSRIGRLTPVKHGVTIQLEKPQIVNGGQTYYTVGHTAEDKLGSASVIARIISLPGSEPQTFMENVIRFNNTQTPVTSRDFHSNDEIQKKLFDKFNAMHPAWFYERKEGLWEAVEDRDRTRFRRAEGRARKSFRVIDNMELAQCRMAWDGRPALPKTKKLKIFEENEKEGGLYPEIFGTGCDSDESMNIFLVSYRLNEMIEENRKKWGEARKTAEMERRDEEFARLERDGFVAFFNFFAIASIGYLMKQFYPQTEIERVLEEPTFARLYDFVVTVFRAYLGAVEAAMEESKRPFSLANWFKSDDNFKKIICRGIDDMIRTSFPHDFMR